MATAQHYCADCDAHFNVSPEEHAEIEHEGGLFRGVENGNWKDFERQHNPERFKSE